MYETFIELVLTSLLTMMAFFFDEFSMEFPVLPPTPTTPTTPTSPTDDCVRSPKSVRARVKAGAYYYPWHTNEFHNGNYLREYLVPRQEPRLGEYDDRDVAVIDQHLAWSKRARISVWAASWWGPGGVTDVTLLDHVLPRLRETCHDGLEVSVFYESRKRTEDYTTVAHVRSDLEHLAVNYFDHTHYYRVGDKPVVIVYLTRALDKRGMLRSVIREMRAGAAAAGHPEIYIIGDEVYREPPDEVPESFQLLDAITNYGVVGGVETKDQLYAGRDQLDIYYEQQRRWRRLAKRAGTAYVPAVTPGYNDRGVRVEKDRRCVSRKLSENDHFGSLFRACLDEAVELVDPAADNL